MLYHFFDLPSLLIIAARNKTKQKAMENIKPARQIFLQRKLTCDMIKSSRISLMDLIQTLLILNHITVFFFVFFF